MEWAAAAKIIDWVTKLFSAASERRRREEQIAYIREKVLWNFGNIGLTKPGIDINGIRPANAIPERANRFNHLMTQLDEIVNHRIPNLSYSEVTALRIAMKQARSIASSPPCAYDDWSDLVSYSCAYRSFQRLKWLKLPAKLPWRNPIDPLVHEMETL